MVAVQRLVAVLDIGTSRVTGLIGEVIEDGSSWGFRILGVGVEASSGIRRGEIRDFEETVRAVRQALKEAERMAGVEVGTVYCGVAGELTAQRFSHGVISIPGSEVRTADLARVRDAARSVAFGNDQRLLHDIPQDYRLDGNPGNSDPIGQRAERVEAEVYLITARSSALMQQKKAVEQAGWHVGDVILEALAAALSALTREERDKGVVQIELGAGSTVVSIFQEGTLRYTTSLRYAGDHLTSDLVHGLQLTRADAERIKVRWGAAFDSMVPAEEMISISAPSGGQARTVPRQTVSHIIGMRLREILEMAFDEVGRAGWSMASLPGGVVLSGGGSSLPGMIEMARDVFVAPVRIADPSVGLKGLNDRVRNPAFAVSVGLALHGARELISGNGLGAGTHAMTRMPRVIGTVKNWLQDFF